MNTTLTMIQTAIVLSISVRELNRLVRARMLTVHHVANRVKHFDAADVLSYIKRAQS